jgi:DnaJ family protein C protein 27
MTGVILMGMEKPQPSLGLFPFEYFRVQVRDREIKVNIFDMAGHPFFYEVRKP